MSITAEKKSRSLGIFGGLIIAAIFIPGGIALRDWRDVGTALPTQTAYVDRNLVASIQTPPIPEADYFREVSALLKREYVEPVKDDQKLASGAVRGMIMSLNDSGSQFFDKNEFQVVLDQREGKFAGIGAAFALVERGEINRNADVALGGQPPETAEESLMTRVRVPRLMVVALTPDGSAMKAGVKVGDVVYEVDQHWVANTDLLVRFQRAQKDFTAKKIKLRDLNIVRKEVREKTERALMPMKALDKLTQGKTGTVRVVWERNGKKRETLMQRALTQQPPNLTAANGVATLRFAPGAEGALQKALSSGIRTFDLRQSVDGNYSTMLSCLTQVAPAGTYGVLDTQRPEKPTPLVLKKGAAKPVKLKLITDSSTRGASAIFARALKKAGIATIVGTPSEDVNVRTTVALPDGTGYTLVTGRYEETAKSKVVAVNVDSEVN